MTRTVVIFLLITPGLLARNYLIEVANKGGDEGVEGQDEGVEGQDEGGDEGADGEGREGGSDYSLNKKLRMVMDAGRGRRSRSRRAGGQKKYVGDTLTLTCNVGSF